MSEKENGLMSNNYISFGVCRSMKEVNEDLVQKLTVKIKLEVLHLCLEQEFSSIKDRSSLDL